MGPEVARDEVIQAEPSWEAAGWGLHAWVKVGGLRVCWRLLWLSSVGKEGGRESLAGPGLPVPSGPDMGGRGGDSCGRGSGPAERSSRTQETGHWGTLLQAANACSQRYNGLLVRPQAGAPGGSGGGEAKQGGGEAGQERTCWTKPRAGPMASPSGALTAQPARSPRGKAEGTGAAGEGGPGRTGLSFSSLCIPQSLCEHLLPSRHKGFLRQRGRSGKALGNSKVTHPLLSRAKVLGGGVWGHFQAAGTTPSELRGVSAVLFGLFGSN